MKHEFLKTFLYLLIEFVNSFLQSTSIYRVNKTNSIKANKYIEELKTLVTELEDCKELDHNFFFSEEFGLIIAEIFLKMHQLIHITNLTVSISSIENSIPDCRPGSIPDCIPYFIPDSLIKPQVKEILRRDREIQPKPTLNLKKIKSHCSMYKVGVKTRSSVKELIKGLSKN